MRLGDSAKRRLIAGLRTAHLIECLNGAASSSRVYALSDLGRSSRSVVAAGALRSVESYFFPRLAWRDYGWCCFSHRRAIVKTLTEPLYPALIKRRARQRWPGIRMSQNNVRDVIRLMRARGIVRPVPMRKRAYPYYELTRRGALIQKLLNRAEVIA